MAKSGMACKPISSSQPLVFEVGKLGEQYWDWVNRPLPGQPRFFANQFLENCSKTVWWVVPAIWLPAYALTTYASLKALKVSAAQVAALQLLGVVLWQLLEYLIHRFMFHASVTSYWGLTLHFLFHGCHHKFPMDAERLVFPPVPAACIAAGIFGVLRILLPCSAAVSLMSGVLLGYVLYDCLHYAIHHAVKLPGEVLRELRIRHNHHHYQDHHRGYGISSVFYDVLFNTSSNLHSSKTQQLAQHTQTF